MAGLWPAKLTAKEKFENDIKDMLGRDVKIQWWCARSCVRNEVITVALVGQVRKQIITMALVGQVPQNFRPLTRATKRFGTLIYPTLQIEPPQVAPQHVNSLFRIL